MISDYERTKQDVLSKHEEFRALVGRLDQLRRKIQKKGEGEYRATYSAPMEGLDIQRKKLERGRFLLMVAGEAKSGKSTFINAYLGREILPMDVKQCTSAIVEIRHGESYKLIATYADSRTETKTDETGIKNFLAQNAALKDEYRDIPVHVINFEMLLKYKDRDILNKYIDDLMKGIKKQNLYQLSDKEYERRVRDYIKEWQPLWRNIVTKIEIEHPYDDPDMRHITIVDTPGVGAEGRLGEIAEEYLKEANAIVFLKPLTGSALESTSFRQFLNTPAADRNKNAKFLLLTRAANENKMNIARLHDEAVRQNPSIRSDQIIPIDSKVELFRKQVKGLTQEELGAHLMNLRKKGEIEDFLRLPWFDADGDRERYLKVLRELSRFDDLDNAMNRFSHKSEFIMLNDFLEPMIAIFSQVSATLDDDIETFEKGADDPIELEARLRNTNEELEGLKKKFHVRVQEIVERYTDEINGIVQNKTRAVFKQFELEINAMTSNSVDELEKLSFRKVDLFLENEIILQKEVVDECDKILLQCSGKLPINYKVIKPNFDRSVIEKIKQERRAQANETEYYTEGTTFKETKSRSVFSQNKFFNLVKDSILSRLRTIQNDVIVDLIDFVVKVTGTYREELARNIKIKQQECDELIKLKNTSEENLANAKLLRSERAGLEAIRAPLEQLKAGIDEYLDED